MIILINEYHFLFPTHTPPALMPIPPTTSVDLVMGGRTAAAAPARVLRGWTVEGHLHFPGEAGGAEDTP